MSVACDRYAITTLRGEMLLNNYYTVHKISQYKSSSTISILFSFEISLLREIIYFNCQINSNSNNKWFKTSRSAKTKKNHSSWWSYGSWIYKCLSNQCLSPLTLWVRIMFKVCQWFAAGRWFSPCTPVSTINKTDHHHITEIFLKWFIGYWAAGTTHWIITGVCHHIIHNAILNKLCRIFLILIFVRDKNWKSHYFYRLHCYNTLKIFYYVPAELLHLFRKAVV